MDASMSFDNPVHNFGENIYGKTDCDVIETRDMEKLSKEISDNGNGTNADNTQNIKRELNEDTELPASLAYVKLTINSSHDEKVDDEIHGGEIRKYMNQLRHKKKMMGLIILAATVLVFFIVAVILFAIQKTTDIGTCEQPSEIQNGTVNHLTGLKHGDAFEIICNDGYELIGPRSVMCLSSSHWSSTSYCQPGKCEPFVSPENAILQGEENNKLLKEAIGVTITIACNKGYRMKGNDTVTCHKNRTWSESPICVATDCGYPSCIPWGMVKDLTGTTVNNTFSVQCNDDSVLNGTETVVCMSNGHWSSLPRCERVSCGMPYIPEHGRITDLEGIAFNSRVLYVCDVGFVLSGNPFAVCQSNGSWSGSPLCFRSDGGFSSWTDWNECSVTCGGGTQDRSRTCTKPNPHYGGANCSGESSQQRSCNTLNCPGTCLVETSQDDCLSGEMCVDLNKKGTITGSLSGVATLSRPTALQGGKECSRQATFKVTFDKLPSDSTNLCHEGNYTQRRMLKVQMYFSKNYRHLFMFNIGDSPSNNGWAGDSGHTDYEAEIQGYGETVNVFANAVNRTDCNAQELYRYIGATNTSASNVNVWIANNYLKVANDDGLCERNCHKCLYGLNGQFTAGSINQDIYVAANRVVSGSYRNGYGLCFMKMSWVDGPEV